MGTKWKKLLRKANVSSDGGRNEGSRKKIGERLLATSKGLDYGRRFLIASRHWHAKLPLPAQVSDQVLAFCSYRILS